MVEEQLEHAFTFEPLGSKHNRAAFTCEVAALESYLRTQARQDLKKRVAVPFVLTPDGQTIAGYYTLSQYAVQLDAIPEEIAKKLPKYSTVPATLLGRLAIDDAFRGQGLGEKLLMDALQRSLTQSKQVASTAVVVDAKDDTAVAFYKKYGFVALPGIPNRLFIAMGTVQQLFPD